MTAQAKPYSPQTLAERWGCSAQKVRLMYRAGELGGFELGKLIRIPAAEVERFECQSTHSQSTERSTPLPTGTGQATGVELRLARETNNAPRQSDATFGRGSTQQEATG